MADKKDKQAPQADKAEAKRGLQVGDRVRIVGGEHDGRFGTVEPGERINVEGEPGETSPTGGRNYCRGGRGGFVTRLDKFSVELVK